LICVARAYTYIGETASEKEGNIGEKYIEYSPSDLEVELEDALNKRGNGLKLARLDLITHLEFTIVRKSINSFYGFKIDYSRIFDMGYSLNQLLGASNENNYFEQIWFSCESGDSDEDLSLDHRNGNIAISPFTMSVEDGIARISSGILKEIMNKLRKKYPKMRLNERENEFILKDAKKFSIHELFEIIAKTKFKI